MMDKTNDKVMIKFSIKTQIKKKYINGHQQQQNEIVAQ